MSTSLKKPAAFEQKSLSEIINKIGQLIISVSDHDKFLKETVRLIQSWGACSYVSVMLLNEQRDRLVMQAACGHGELLAGRDCYIPTDTESIASLVCETGETHLSDDLNTESPVPLTEVLPGMQSKLVLPLRIRKEIIGVLDIQSHRPGVFGREDQTILQILADQISISINMDRSHSQVQQELKQAIQAETMLQKSYNDLNIRARNKTAEHLRNIELLRREILDRRMAEKELKENRQTGTTLQKSYNDLETKLREQTTEHLRTIELLRREILERRLAEQELWENRQSGESFKKAYNDLENRAMKRNAEHLRTIEFFRREMLEHKRTEDDILRLETELKVAHQLQQMVLPDPEKLQNIKNADIASFMESADNVGGDYYYILQYNETTRIVIGDVAGHGLENGVLMFMTHTALHTLLNQGETDPKRVMSILNHIICKNLQRMNLDKSLSLTLALIDYTPLSVLSSDSEDKGGQVKVSGQHEMMIVARQDGNTELVDTAGLGIPVGLEENIAGYIDETTVILQPNDGVVLYSDGITKTKNVSGELYGLEQLCKIISQNWRKPAKKIVQSVIEDVRRHIGRQKQSDDLTLVVLKQQ